MPDEMPMIVSADDGGPPPPPERTFSPSGHHETCPMSKTHEELKGKLPACTCTYGQI